MAVIFVELCFVHSGKRIIIGNGLEIIWQRFLFCFGHIMVKFTFLGEITDGLFTMKDTKMTYKRSDETYSGIILNHNL